LKLTTHFSFNLMKYKCQVAGASEMYNLCTLSTEF
jgi:hypothetical protein